MQQITQIIAEKIRPILALHNGDIELVGVTSDGFVKVKLTGACAACPGAQQDNKQISIKFCGGCNPRIDRGRVAEKVREILAKNGFAVFYNRLDVNFVIYISGCSADCARRYSSTSCPHTAVHGPAVDSMAVTEGQIVIEIINRVRDYFERLEKGLPGQNCQR